MRSMEAVTTLERACLAEAMPPAVSMYLRMTPPWTFPDGISLGFHARVHKFGPPGFEVLFVGHDGRGAIGRGLAIDVVVGDYVARGFGQVHSDGLVGAAEARQTGRDGDRSDEAIHGASRTHE